MRLPLRSFAVRDNLLIREVGDVSMPRESHPRVEFDRRGRFFPFKPSRRQQAGNTTMVRTRPRTRRAKLIKKRRCSKCGSVLHPSDKRCKRCAAPQI
jgi:hypothetical protein